MEAEHPAVGSRLPVHIGHYRIIDRIGKGAMGVVYRARDEQLDRNVAVKVMMTDFAEEPDVRARFYREAQSAGRLLHRNIITIFDLGDDRGRAYIVMELLDGATLASGSGRVEALDIDLTNPVSIANARQRLDTVPELFRRSLGIVVADVADTSGVVVVTVADGSEAAAAGIGAGDILTRVDTEMVSSAGALAATLLRRKTGDRVAVDVRTAAGADRHVELPVTSARRLISRDDQTLLFNKLILDLRARLAKPGSEEEPVLRLNLAVAEMAVDDYAEAIALLEKVNLPRGGGVGYGTVQFLLAECRRLRKEPALEAEARLAAASDPEALLTEDGPSIKELLATPRK